MSGHLDAGFGPLELEALEPEDQAAARAHLAACAACADQHRVAAEGLVALTLALPEAAPPPPLRDRILRSVSGVSRFDDFAERTARIIDVAVDKARALLARIDDPAAWSDGPLPGVRLYHLDGGPAMANAVVGLVRIKPGSVFPEHTHQGTEVALVLQGSCVEGDGRVSRRGDLLQMESSSTHMLTALPGPDLVYVAAVQNGFLLFGEHIKPGDPRA